MGKRLIQQRRGRGTPRYRSASHRFKGEAKLPPVSKEAVYGRIVDIVHCPGHDAPLLAVEYSNGHVGYTIAPENISTKDFITVISKEAIKEDPELEKDIVKTGNVVELGLIPEGTEVFNVETKIGDGGKFIRTSGVSGKVVAKRGDNVVVVMPSKREKLFKSTCRAMIGSAAGAGRREKPLVKAGAKHYKMKARNKLYPIVSGIAMNAVDHPFGKSRSSKKGKPTIARKHAPAGAKVGKIRPRKTGKRN